MLKVCKKIGLKIDARKGKRKINEIGHKVIKDIVKCDPAITLRELADLYYRKMKIRVGHMTMWIFCSEKELLKEDNRKINKTGQEIIKNIVKGNSTISMKLTRLYCRKRGIRVNEKTIRKTCAILGLYKKV